MAFFVSVFEKHIKSVGHCSDWVEANLAVFSHTTNQLHWLPVERRIQFKLCLTHDTCFDVGLYRYAAPDYIYRSSNCSCHLWLTRFLMTFDTFAQRFI